MYILTHLFLLYIYIKHSPSEEIGTHIPTGQIILITPEIYIYTKNNVLIYKQFMINLKYFSLYHINKYFMCSSIIFDLLKCSCQISELLMRTAIKLFYLFGVQLQYNLYSTYIECIIYSSYIAL